MHPRLFMRRAIALAFAYAFALQTGMAAAAAVVPGGPVTCLSAARDADHGAGKKIPAGHPCCAMCALAGHVLAPLPRAGATVEPGVRAVRHLTRLAGPFPVASPRSKSAAARAPPRD